MENNSPFYTATAALAGRGPRFFVPGHKGNPAAIPPFAALLQQDITEIPGAFSLAQPSGALLKSQQNMARVFGSGATLYSASGTTSCIMAMLALFLGQGQAVVLARGCHVAAVRALAFLGARPHWLLPKNGRVNPADIANMLAKSGAKVVYITSPSYYGHMADIAAISALCHKAGASLLIDNAHGAYLRFLKKDMHPLSLGADACADSAHKTLPCLTPAALLHLRNKGLAQKARDMLNLFSSTSPAYPVLQSLDLAAGMFLSGTAPSYSAAAARLAQSARLLKSIVQPCQDPLRLCLCPALAGYAPGAFAAGLLRLGIAPEYFDGYTLVFMSSPYNSPDDYSRLESAVQQLMQTLPRFNPASSANAAAFPEGNSPSQKHAQAAHFYKNPYGESLPKQLLPMGQALFAQHSLLPIQRAVGRIMGGLHAPCPPGVALVLPGEEINKNFALRLAAGGVLKVNVVK